MTTTLRVIVDDIVAPHRGGMGRYAEELTRELIRTAPRDCEVTGVVASSPSADYDRITTLLPGLADLHKTALARRELQLAWQHGITRLPGSGMVHAPSAMAPLSRHDRVNNPTEQTVVTFHDAIAWTHPHLLNPRTAAWTRGMAKRAQRYADAVVAPTYSVAADLADALDLGDRIRVIGGAVSPKLAVPVDAESRADALELPDEYLLTTGTNEPRKNIEAIVRSLSSPADSHLPLLIAGADGWGAVDIEAIARDAGVDVERVRSLGFLEDADLATVIDRATVFVLPTLADGFGLSMLEAFHLGTPVVHSDAPAVVEVSAGAGLEVALGDADLFPDRLAEAVRSVVTDPLLARRMSYAGLDRAAAFSWKDSAERVWQLHADL